MIIDTHAHVIVPGITREAAPEESWRPAVSWQSETQVIDFMGKKITSAVREFVDIAHIVVAQDQAQIDRVLLAPWVSIVRYSADPQEGLRISQIQNDGIADMVSQYPDRVMGLGTVPMQDPTRSVQELERVMQMPGMYGVELAASVNGIYLGDEQFRPFWEAASDLDAFVLIHPTTRGFKLDIFNEYYLWNTVGNPMETTITAAHMIFSGLMADLPQLKVMLAHAGGTLMSLRGRLRHAHSFQPLAQAKLKEPFEDSLKRFYFDTITHDASVLQSLIDYVGVERILLGSDYPFDMGDLTPVDTVNSLSISEGDRALILGGNASRLLGVSS